ncbi:hypothetical protein [Runella sp.]|uniref:hypothetical protein n=1 Tax=Runella sp. TaxID=1960881 RepID=UPI003018A03D
MTAAADRPDIRLVPDASKGGLIFWFRYRLIEQKKFSLRIGSHPAFTLIRRNLTENGKTTEITELLRFLAFEVVPNYKITPNWSIGAVYLHGSGLQKNGPQNTDVFFLNNSIFQHQGRRRYQTASYSDGVFVAYRRQPRNLFFRNRHSVQKGFSVHASIYDKPNFPVEYIR